MTSARKNAEVGSAHAAKQGMRFRTDNACAGGAGDRRLQQHFPQKSGERRDGVPEERRSNHQEW